MALEPPNSPRGARSESTVEPPRAEPMTPKQELEHADVVAGHGWPDDPCAEERPAEPAEGGSRAWAGETVDREVPTALERAHGVPGLRPLDPVDRPVVDAALAQGDLQSRDLRIDRRGGRSKNERGA